MFFQIGNRIVEVRRSHIILGSSLLLICLILLFYGVIRKGYFSIFKSIAFQLSLSATIFIFTIYLFFKFDIISKLRPGFGFEYKMMEIINGITGMIKKLGDNLMKVFAVIAIILVLFSGVFYVSKFGMPNIDIPEIKMPNINLKNALGEKQPSVESPKGQEKIENKIKETTTTVKKTTTTIKTTITSTTTTTRKKPSPEGRVSGFFVYKKETEDYKDCTFEGKGHDAVLMPSGNYYCRSNEQRVTIKIDGVEKVCCVSP